MGFGWSKEIKFVQLVILNNDLFASYHPTPPAWLSTHQDHYSHALSNGSENISEMIYVCVCVCENAVQQRNTFSLQNVHIESLSH